ncbi:MAG TPA: hypothetical protein VNC16_00570 [Solirubrobacterales bacterium]|jgi:hypothetical protein|nr:hypothetical protein [Solirubrobacterales bacterium]
MNKKLIPLAAAALSALAFLSVPTGASAGEYEAHCEKEGVVQATCNATISGGFIELSDTSGLRWHCKTLVGSGAFTTTTSTGTATLELNECTDFVFGTECNNQGAGTKRIKTNALVSHFVNLEPAPGTTPGVLFTGFNLTFSCPAMGVKKTYTGSLIGHLEEPSTVCNKAVSSFKLNFEKTANGQQLFKQVTTTGTIFDLISSNDVGGAYLTQAITGTVAVSILEGRAIKITC